MRPHQHLRFIFEHTRKDRHRSRIAAIAKCNRGVAEQPAALGSLDGRLAESLPKARIVESHNISECRREIGIDLGGACRIAIPRAHFLANIAPENPITKPSPQLLWNWSAMLNGQV